MQAQNSHNFELQLDSRAFEALDEFAMLVQRDYNSPDTSEWLSAFQGGLYGLYARTYGVTTHYRDVHAWLARPRSARETEFHLASIFFNMDSAVECLAFALNALGYCVLPNEFRDIRDPAQLRQICPIDITGRKKRAPIAGYAKLFPSLQALWQENARLLDIVIEQHDVSKHRQTIYVGGQARLDPPHGFYQSLGVIDDKSIRATFWPMAEIQIEVGRKQSAAHARSRTKSMLVEDLVPQFCSFIEKSGWQAFSDTQKHIPIKPGYFPN